MKEHKREIILALAFWIPLTVVRYKNSTDQYEWPRLFHAVAYGPMAVFFAGLVALPITVIMGLIIYIRNKIEVPPSTINWLPLLSDLFTAVAGVAFLIIYYCMITNQTITINFHGGW